MVKPLGSDLPISSGHILHRTQPHVGPHREDMERKYGAGSPSKWTCGWNGIFHCDCAERWDLKEVIGCEDSAPMTVVTLSPENGASRSGSGLLMRGTVGIISSSSAHGSCESGEAKAVPYAGS